jgi:hypothetical protein
MFNSKSKEVRNVHDLGRDFDAAVKTLVKDACDSNIDLNLVAAMLPHYVGAFRVTVAKMIAEEHMNRIAEEQKQKPKKREVASFDARRGVETR